MLLISVPMVLNELGNKKGEAFNFPFHSECQHFPFLRYANDFSRKNGVLQ
jgi:hypothetical protein